MSTSAQALFERRLGDGSLCVGVVGLGYVGLPLCRAFVDAGLRVLGFDVDPGKIAALERGENYLPHLGADFTRALRPGGLFEGTANFSRLGEADAVLVCVPTPLGRHLEPDLSYVERTTADIARSLRAGQLVCLESTTYPGTTREVMLPMLEAGGLRCGEDFFLAYSPEREDPGRRDRSTKAIPKLVGGIDGVSGELAVALYRRAIDAVVPVSSAEVGESAKLLENIYRAVNIALVNEMKLVLGAMGIDIWEVIDAAATKPFGFQAFYPGPGLGGHCIPIDPFYLTWKAREHGLATRFIELAGEINHAMPEHVVRRVGEALNDEGKALKGSRVLVLGLAYKKDVADVRESPALVLIERLQDAGAVVEYSDPHVPRTHRMRKHDLKMESVALTGERVASYDCVLVATDHAAFDWAMIAAHARVVVDTRNAIRGRGLETRRWVGA
ncbi:MAG: nucleotide sugar dehydrogenase [Phycisphaerales bacterium]